MSIFSGTSTPKIGSLDIFPINRVPDGYLPANGAAISRATYADLFAVIGTTFGSGNGSTTFNLPNYQNARFLNAIDANTTSPVYGNKKPMMFVQKPDDKTDIKRRCFFQRNNDGQPSVQVGGYKNTTLPYATSDTPADYFNAFGLDTNAAMSGVVANVQKTSRIWVFIKY